MTNELLDLIEITRVKELTEYLYQIIKIPFAISDSKGSILVKTNDFDRNRGLKCNQEQCINQGIKKCNNTYTLFKCTVGFMNAITPLYINNTLMGYIHLNHFFIEKIDIKKLLYENIETGSGNHESLLEIPVIEEKRAESILTYLSKTINLLVESAVIQLKNTNTQGELSSIKEEMEASFQQLAAAEAELMENYHELVTKEKALRESDERYRLLFSSMNQGMAHHKIITNEEGLPLDYRYLGINLSYEKMTNLKQEYIVGRTAREVIPNIEDYWIKEYGEVALTGRPKEFESYSERLNKYFKIYAYSPKPEEFALLISDITEERKLDLKLRKSLMEIVESLGYMIEKRDLYTAGHQKNVSKLACRIGKHMGLSENQLEGLYVAAILHDIGKIGIPSEILTKPATLSALEFNLIKTHPQNAYEILKSIDFQWPVAEIILQHHEKLDGSGYPFGLSAKDILLEARIITVADVVEAIASHRPYRPALGLRYAIEEIDRNSGKFYDKEIVNACIKICTDDVDIFNN